MSQRELEAYVEIKAIAREGCRIVFTVLALAGCFGLGLLYSLVDSVGPALPPDAQSVVYIVSAILALMVVVCAWGAFSPESL